MTEPQRTELHRGGPGWNAVLADEPAANEALAAASGVDTLLRYLARRVADRLACAGFAYIEEERQLDELAGVLRRFLATSGIPVYSTRSGQGQDERDR